MFRRIGSALLFLIVLVAYLILPFMGVRKYVTPPEKKKLFEKARKWKEKQDEVMVKYRAEVKEKIREIDGNPNLTADEKKIKIRQAKEEIRSNYPTLARGHEFHEKLVSMGVTGDVPLLIGIYFILGIFLFWIYRRFAKKTDSFTLRIQYTSYLFILSIFIIITTFGFGFTATYIYNPHWWQLQHPIQEFAAPLQQTPFIAFHFIVFALNAAAMGPLDHYMSVRPDSLQISLMQWVERLFVISVLFSSISRVWFRRERGEEGGAGSETVI